MRLIAAFILAGLVPAHAQKLLDEHGQSLEFARGWCVATMTYELAEYGRMRDQMNRQIPMQRILVEGIKLKLADGRTFHCTIEAALEPG